MWGARPTSRSLKSIPCGGRAIRTRRPSRTQRRAASVAAASPASSASARRTMSRSSFERWRLRSPEAESAAHVRYPVACMGREARFDTLTDQQQSAQAAETNNTTGGRAQHHFCRINGRLCKSIPSNESPVYGNRLLVPGPGDYRDHCRPGAAGRMLQSQMRPNGRRNRTCNSATSEIGLNNRVFCRLRIGPDAEGTRGAVEVRLDHRARGMQRWRPAYGPKATRAQGSDHIF